MKTIISKYFRKSAFALLALPLMGIAGGALTSCADMLDTDSDMIDFVEENPLNHPKDSMSMAIGIMHRMQYIADRTIFLGDIRSDQFTLTPYATVAIQELANHQVSDDNPYNKISDYYAIINNCNYFIENADTSLTRLGQKVFEKEFAAIKTYRAWTYLQLAKNYGEVPFITKPVLTEQEGLDAMNMPYSDLKTICDYLIDDIKPFVDTEFPPYGNIYYGDSKKYFVPVRVLLGELCLWAGRYQEAADYLYDYLTFKNRAVTTGRESVGWNVSNKDFINGSINKGQFAYNCVTFQRSELITGIPMESSELYGITSKKEDVFESTANNFYYVQALPSEAMKQLSKAQDYIYLNEISATKKDTVYVQKEGLKKNLWAGDLRLAAAYDWNKYNRDETSEFFEEIHSVTKMSSESAPLYRVQYVYLMYAEALNCLGYPSAAVCVLKYGLRDQMIEKYVPAQERELAGRLLKFDDEIFTSGNTLGIHARGCGNVECDTLYRAPLPENALASYADTAKFQQPYVEQMIIDEMGLESLYEGKRFYDLMRVALRRNDPAYLADAVARRNGKIDEALRARLMEKKNWYLPIKK